MYDSNDCIHDNVSLVVVVIVIVVYCDDPGIPKDAIRHGNSFQYGERVWYSCHNHTHLVGPTYIWCNGDGEWSDEPPLCRSMLQCVCVLYY